MNNEYGTDHLENRYFSAVHTGDTDQLEKLIQEGTDINFTDGQGHSGFYYSVWGNDPDLIAFYLDRKINRSERDQQGCSALHWAAQAGALEAVRLLLDYSFDTEERDRGGRTPLWYAVAGGHAELTEYLLSEYADPEARDLIGETVLHFAAQMGSRPILKAMIDKGADPRSKTIGGRTLLHAAVQNKNEQNALEIIFWLLTEHSLSPMDQDDFGQTPIDNAAYQGRRPLIELFLDLKIAPVFNTVRNAIAAGSEEIVELLLNWGIDPNLRETGSGRTFLHYAVKDASAKMIRLLAEKGIDKNTPDCYGETALFYAISKKDLRTFFYLIENGADPNLINEDGRNVLHQACLTGELRAVRYLIEKKKMDPHQNDLNGLSAFDLAKRSGDLDLALYLRADTR